ncbi:MAG: ABC transporter substrate-binding protein [Stenotrophomonas sp.]
MADDTVKLGVISSQTGAFAAIGTQGDLGTQYAVEELNAKGGILGHKIELATIDDTSQPEATGRAFRKLASENVAVVLGNTDFAEAASALAKEIKVPYISAAAGYGRALTEENGHRYVFRLVANPRGFYGPIADALKELPYKRWCTIGVDFTPGHDLVSNIWANLKKNNPDIEVIDGCELWVPLGQTDFSSYITAIISHQPDALLFAGLVAYAPVPFIKQANSFGLFSTIPAIHATLGWPGNTVGLEQADVPQNIVSSGDFPYPPPADRPEARAFIDGFKKRFGVLPLSEAANSYAAVKFVAAAFEKAGSFDREKFIDAGEGLTIDHPIGGKITIRAFDHQSTQGVYVGKLAWDEIDQHAGIADVEHVDVIPYLLTEDQIRKARAAVGN